MGCNLFEWGTFLRRLDNFLMDLSAEPEKVEALSSGRVPFFEPGLPELLTKNLESGRLRFTTSFPALVAGLLGLTEETTLVNRSDFYDERYPFGTLVPAVATDSFTVVGTGSGPGL